MIESNQVDSYVFYKSFYDGMKNMSMEDVAAANHALHSYALYGVEPESDSLSPIVQTLFVMAKPQIDANRKKRLDGAKGAIYGKQGGRPKKNPIGDMNKTPNVNDNDNVNDNVNLNEKEKSPDFSIEKPIKKTTCFIKPTVEEIQAYCNERKNSVNPQQFYDFYEARGWCVGKSKMRDWKAAVRTWERNSFAFTQSNNSKQDYFSKIDQEYFNNNPIPEAGF